MTTYNETGLTYEDTSITYDGLDDTRAISVLLGSLASAEDITPYVNMASLVIEDNGTSGRGTTTCHVERTLAQLTTLGEQSLLRVIDHAEHADMARGIIYAKTPSSVPAYSAVDLLASDVGGLIDDTFIVSESRSAETMQARITALWLAYAPSPPLDIADLSFVASIGSTLPAQVFSGVTLRQAIEASMSQASASADYYIDAAGRIHVFTSESNPAPSNIDADAPGAGEIAPQDLSLEYDASSYANRVYIAGGTPDGSGFFSDTAAITAAAGIVRTAVVNAPDCTTSAMATALSNMYLGRVSTSKPRGSFTSTLDGWRAGQNVSITSADFGLSAESFRIAKVQTRVLVGGSGAVRSYVVEFGGGRAGGTGGQQDLGTGQLVSGQLGGASNTYVTSDGVSVTDGANVRVELGATGADYGLRVTSSDGATVIIDGTSNMFKIAATGTQSLTGVNGSGAGGGSALTSVTLSTGLAYCPAALMYFNFNSTTNARLLEIVSYDNTNGGGDSGNISDRYYGEIKWLTSPDRTQVFFIWDTRTDRSAQSIGMRYHILKEAGI